MNYETMQKIRDLLDKRSQVTARRRLIEGIEAASIHNAYVTAAVVLDRRLSGLIAPDTTRFDLRSDAAAQRSDYAREDQPFSDSIRPRIVAILLQDLQRQWEDLTEKLASLGFEEG